MEFKITEGFSISWEQNLVKAIEKMRAERGMPRTMICCRTGVKQGQYDEFVKGTSSLTFHALANIFNVLDVDMTIKLKEHGKEIDE